jgi:hypothetical protein
VSSSGRTTIRQAALALPQTDQQAFIDAAESELLALHEGNFARYRVTPSQFQDWRALWKR